MKTPPLLLGATLLFWGWQTDFLIPGVVMALALEGARWIPSRWELSDEEFSLIWTFCLVLLLAAVVYAFTANGGPSQVGHLLREPTLANQSSAGAASARTAMTLFRWTPMIFFLFVAAQAYSGRQELPLTTLSHFLRRRWQNASTRGQTAAPVPGINVTFPYFGLCLFAACNHPADTHAYFWGFDVLLAWALWSRRSLRFGAATWLGVLGLAMVLGYAGQRGIGRLTTLVTNLDPQWLSRFVRGGAEPTQTRTALGQVGRQKLSGRIVIRLRPDIGYAPPYLREASYREFASPAWLADDSHAEPVNLFPGTNGTTWVLLPDKTNASRVQIACYLNGTSRESGQRVGLLPLPGGVDRLENLAAFPVRKYPTGAVLAEGPGLVIFDATYGPGTTIDAPPGDQDLDVPAAEKPALRQVIAKLGASSGDPAEKVRAVKDFFMENFTYGFWQDRPRAAGTNESPLSQFLLITHKGHCEYFATATVLLLRELGIPARYAIGYAVHERSGQGYVVRERDAHAWCLAWNQRSGSWYDVDTTPASWIAEESRRASPLQRLEDLGSWVGFQFSKFRWGHTHLRQYALVTLIPVMGLLLYRIFFQRNRRTRRRLATEVEPVVVWPGLDSEFYAIETLLARRGAERHPNELLSRWLERAADEPLLEPVRPRLTELLRLHYRFRFDPLGLNVEERRRLKEESRAVLDRLGQSPAGRRSGR